MVHLSVDLKSYFCNHWPYLSILHNDIEIYRDNVVEQCTLDFNLVDAKSFTIKFVHFGKHFGENGVFDTNVEQDLDCKLQILDIKLDGVSIGPKLHSNLKFIAFPTVQQRNDDAWMQNFSIIERTNGWMTFNGCIDFTFTTPVYDWLILNKYKIQRTHDHAYFSGFSDRWHYAEDLELLSDICKLMNLDENSSHSST